MRESPIERECCHIATLVGVGNVKLAGMGDDGKPDRLFILPRGRVWWVEFKAPTKDMSDLQSWWATLLKSKGHAHDRIDDVDMFKTRLKELLR